MFSGVSKTREKYEQYAGTEMITVPQKELYTDCEGFFNEKAFRDFVSTLTEADGYRLICLAIDVSAMNKKSYARGSFVLRTVVLKLNEYFCVFRVNGDKFNILVQEKDYENLRLFLKQNSKLYSLYYGFVKDIIITDKTVNEARRIGIAMMYDNKAAHTKKKNSIREDKIVGDKGNTPVELQETAIHKFKQTMWYTTIVIKERYPYAKDVMVYAFPTEFKPPLSALNMIVVVDDLLERYVYTGKDIHFGFDGMRFNICSRFDRAGHLSISLFKDRKSQGKYETDIKCHEGNCIPVFFGKRIDNEQEIYPIKRNAFGTQDYVLWDAKTNKAIIVDTGIVKVKDKEYAVYADDIGIDLCNLN